MARKALTAATVPARKQKLGPITEVSSRTAENGFIVTVRDKNYNSKDFIASSPKEAVALMEKYSGGAKS